MRDIKERHFSYANAANRKEERRVYWTPHFFLRLLERNVDVTMALKTTKKVIKEELCFLAFLAEKHGSVCLMMDGFCVVFKMDVNLMKLVATTAYPPSDAKKQQGEEYCSKRGTYMLDRRHQF